MGYTGSGCWIYGFQTNLIVINKRDGHLPGDIPLFIISKLPSHLHECRGHGVCHVILFILLISLRCAFMKCNAVTVLRFWVFCINTGSVITLNHQAFHYPSRSSSTLPMNNLSPTSPFSFSNNSDCGSNHHDNVPISSNSSQLRELPLLDGIRPHNYSQLDPIRPTHYANALKFDLGGGVMVILKSPHLSQNYVLNFPGVTLQGSFP